MPRPLVVHVGLPKTGTTTLQKGLFAHHSEIAFLGKRAGKNFDSDLRRCVSEAAFRLGNQIFWQHARDPDMDLARRIYRDEVLPSVDDRRVPLFSFEGLAVADLEDRRAVAENIRALCPDARIVFGIRRPPDLVAALYFQRRKRLHFGHPTERERRDRSTSTDAWLAAIVRGTEMAEHLDYARSIRLFVEALGRDNVGVFVFEALVEDPEGFATSLCRFLDIEAEEGIRLVGTRRENRRLTQPVLDRLARFERPGWLATLYGLAGPRMRKRLVGQGRFEDATPGRLVVPAQVQNEIDARTRAGNRWIANTWALPLEEYGYAL